ncbi:uncharacterized protein LOC130282104 isoform X1 [Hyla sarda]|uniref:uncharacterized protein LOC130282104 isoform X1 n=1 Tax=Hyla sarda TaxID=327740 RepID=UPI0024C2A666|nr:uncharacterized protein LOC130282104 isoform X1 [Hyla sarda]
MAATGGRRDGEKERGEKREEESGGKRKREEESEEVKESGKKRKEEEVSEEVKKRKREEESEEVKSREKRKEEDVSEEVKKRKIEEESKEVEKTGEKRKEEEVSEEVKKRKREEESEDVEKRRGEDARLLEDEEPRPGTSQDPGTSSSYPKFNIYHLTVHQVLGRGSFGVGNATRQSRHRSGGKDQSSQAHFINSKKVSTHTLSLSSSSVNVNQVPVIEPKERKVICCSVPNPDPVHITFYVSRTCISLTNSIYILVTCFVFLPCGGGVSISFPH